MCFCLDVKKKEVIHLLNLQLLLFFLPNLIVSLFLFMLVNCSVQLVLFKRYLKVEIRTYCMHYPTAHSPHPVYHAQQLRLLIIGEG